MKRPIEAKPATPAPDTAKIMVALQGSPFVREALSGARGREIAERQALVDALAELNRDAVGQYQRHEAELAAAVQAQTAAKLNLEEAQRQVAAANQKKLVASFARDAKRQELEIGLARTEHLAIAPFLVEMREDDGATRKSFASFGLDLQKNQVTGARFPIVRNNGESIRRRLEAIRKAVEEAEGLRMLPDQSGVPARLEQLRRGLPAVE